MGGGNPIKKVANIGGSIVTGGQKNNVFGGGSPIASTLDKTVKMPIAGGGLASANSVVSPNGARSNYVPIKEQLVKISNADVQKMSKARDADLKAMIGREGLSNASLNNIFSPAPMRQGYVLPAQSAQPSGAKGAIQPALNQQQPASSAKGAIKQPSSSSVKGAS